MKAAGLVLMTLGLVLSACGGERSAETSVVTVTNVETVTTAAPKPPRSYARFQMPSKNIGCGYDSGVLRCDILSGLRPEPSDPCELDWVGFALERSGPADPVCAGDTVYDGSAPVLAYGESWSSGGISCESLEAGLRCKNGAGHGFSLARASSRAF